jgi:hypothetical protein
LRIWRRERCGRTLLVRQFCLEQNWTAEGWPRSAQREGVGPMDGPNNPREPHATVQHTGRHFAYLAEKHRQPQPRTHTTPGSSSQFAPTISAISRRLAKNGAWTRGAVATGPWPGRDAPHRPFRFCPENTINSLDARLANKHGEMSRQYAA